MTYQFQSGILSTTEDVLKRLSSLNAELELLREKLGFEEKFSFIIFGGTALLLYTNYRVTSDIDCYYLNTISASEVEGIIANHGVNNRIEGLMTAPVVEDFIPRSNLILETDVLEVRVASKEDLILSKLFSTRGTDSDERDLIDSGIFEGDIDLVYIETVFNEFESARIGSRVNFSSLDDILKKIAEKEEIINK
ncbi:DUF6036 family nucleotidyltransferase [Cytobacillus praedii]|uniref:DUF6036 family nucleotidyltransferase n=1 Tax=Cytobacillus praedii TaxID=1742358 RepID=UPI003F8232C5